MHVFTKFSKQKVHFYSKSGSPFKTSVKDKTALHLAAEKGHASVVYALGDAGAMMITQENVEKESPLHRTVLF